MSTKEPKFGQKIKAFWSEYEFKIILALGFILVSLVSFQFGFIQAKNGQNSPLIIEKQAQCANDQAKASPEGQILAPEAQKQPESMNIPPATCSFVGSKNSDKYHLPTCQYAKRIKPENRVCFSTEEEAQAKNYKRAGCCFK